MRHFDRNLDFFIDGRIIIGCDRDGSGTFTDGNDIAVFIDLDNSFIVRGECYGFIRCIVGCDGNNNLIGFFGCKLDFGLVNRDIRYGDFAPGADDMHIIFNHKRTVCDIGILR